MSTLGDLTELLNHNCRVLEKRLTKLTDKLLYLGLGWLLREDKVVVSDSEGGLFVRLA